MSYRLLPFPTQSLFMGKQALANMILRSALPRPYCVNAQSPMSANLAGNVRRAAGLQLAITPILWR